MKLRNLVLSALLLTGSSVLIAQKTTTMDHVRCYSMEADAKLRQAHPELGSLNDFENWLAPKVANYNTSGHRTTAVQTIPVIFHIIHSNEAAGSGRNISAAYVNAQLDQLNNDFRRKVGTSGYNTNAVGADTEIEFCLATLDENGNTLTEPGINRVSITGAPFSDTYVENTIKPATQWDPEQYMNVWSCDMSGGILGYAQFPSQSGLSGLNTNGGAANTDGVVVRYTTIGSTTNPFPNAAPYNEGRTLTHEVGHWLGLRHIWGDGGCGVDDYCNDTPESDNSNFGCPTGHSSCGSTDMVQNYMDYTDDDCMNIYTQDQKSRIQAVMANSPRRANLATSDRCGTGNPPGGLNCATTVSSFPYSEGFESGTGSWTQGSGDDIDWTNRSGSTPSSGTGPTAASEGSNYMYIEASSPNYPTKNGILLSPCFDLSGETAASFNFDYHMLGSAVGTLDLEANTGSGWSSIWSLSGDQGSNWASQSVNLSAYLGTTVQLRFVGTTATSWQGDICIDATSITASGGPIGGGSCTANVSSFPYSESFESGLGLWSQGSGDDFDWTRNSGGTPSSGTGPSAADDGSFYAYCETSNPNNPSKVAVLNGPCFDLSSASQADFSFSYHMLGTAVGSLNLEASADDGASWSSVWSISGSQGSAWNAQSVDLSAYLGSTVRVRFVGTSGSSWSGDLCVDDIGLSTSNSGPTCENISLALTFDQYPEETSWAITDGVGSVVASGGTYASAADNSSLIETACLPNGCYTFTISDAYGDGMCCSYGNGSYTLTNSTGSVLASGGSFTSSEATNFCLTNASREEVTVAQAASASFQDVNLFPNPTRSIVNLGFEAAVASQGEVTVVDLTGRILVKQSLDITAGRNQIQLSVSDLAAGSYLLFLRNGEGQVSKRFVVMD